MTVNALYAQRHPPSTYKGHPDLQGGTSLRPIASGKLKQLHKALSRSIPGLFDTEFLQSAYMDAAFQRALQSETAGEFKRHYLDANILKRFQSSDEKTVASRQEAAVQLLLDSEIRCRVSNGALLESTETRGWVPTHIRAKLARTKKILFEILGEFPMEELPRACNFGPGATVELSRKKGALHNKWALLTQITPRALPYAHAFVHWTGLTAPSYQSYTHDPLSPEEIYNLTGVTQAVCADWALTEGFFSRFSADAYQGFTLVECNKVFTVPKNFERDRTACLPVGWNSFLQKGVGKLIKRRLNRKKLLHRDAQIEHQLLARLASIFGTLSTLDLKGASDGIGLVLVAEVFPESWVRVLLDLREEKGELPSGDIVTWEKLSTMGNGFTFEAETALFYALVVSCCGRDSLVSVYGDDIICPTQYAEEVIELMMYCGFEINREKTFTTGPFRESCGGHYFAGVDVKPFYITSLPKDVNDVINLHNDIIKWYGRYPRKGDRFFTVWRRCREIVPRAMWGPPGLQGVCWAEWDDCRPEWCPGLQAWRVKGVAYKVDESSDLHDHVGAILQKLWETSTQEEPGGETSTYRDIGEVPKGCWRVVDRAQWTTVRAETLCT